MQFPPELLNQIGVALELIVAAVVALTVAFWIAMVVWVFRDIRLRTRDVFAWILAAVLALAMGPVGVILYLFLRPKETLAEVYDRQLEEEALLRDISLRRACPGCQAVTEPEWLVCPHCKTELRRLCQSCGKPMDLNWLVCPYCCAAPEVRPVQSLPAPSVFAQPAVQPAQPAVQPAQPAVQPAQPAVQPAQPAVQPAPVVNLPANGQSPVQPASAPGDGWGVQG